MKKIQQLSKSEKRMIFEAVMSTKDFQNGMCYFFERVVKFSTDIKEFRAALESPEACIVQVICRQKAVDGSLDFMFGFYPVSFTKASNGVSNICKLKIWHDLSMQSKDPFSCLLLMLNDDWWFSDQAKELIRKHCDLEFKNDQRARKSLCKRE